MEGFWTFSGWPHGALELQDRDCMIVLSTATCPGVNGSQLARLAGEVSVFLSTTAFAFWKGLEGA